MTTFIIRRVVWTIPVILLVILMTFVMMRQIKGNPFRKSERAIPEQIQANLNAKFGLDDPWYVQYTNYVKGVFTLDLGPSMVLRSQSVNDIIAEHFPKSLELGGLAFLFAALFGTPLGAFAALSANTYRDYAAMFFFGFWTFAIRSFACAMSALCLAHGESLWIVLNPGMPFGTNPVAGTWSAWAMLSMIDWRSIASDIARRWLTSVMFFVLNP